MENFSRPLVDWYKKEARPLPWREEPTPYRVWVSEIMLQQTRVEAVKPYFERFTKELPDVAALAACSEPWMIERVYKKLNAKVRERFGGTYGMQRGE